MSGWKFTPVLSALAATMACGSDDVAELESGSTGGSSTTETAADTGDDGSEDPPRPTCQTPGFGTTVELAPMSIGRVRHTASELSDGDLVVVGGFACDEAGRETPLVSVTRYSRGDDAWVELAPLSRGVADHTAVVLQNDRLVVLGGVTDSGATAEVSVYDATTDVWSSGTPLQEAIDHPLAVVLGEGRVFVIDGYHGYRAYLLGQDEVAWSPTSEVSGVGDWSSLVGLPDGRAVVASSGQSPGILVVYDPVLDTWADADPLDTSGWIGAAALLTENVVLSMHERAADSEGAAVGESVFWNSDDENHDWPGGGFCCESVHAWGRVTNARGVGRGTGRAMVFAECSSFMYDVDVGWANPTDLEIPSDGAAILALADGGFMVFGGESSYFGCDHAARVQLWTP